MKPNHTKSMTKQKAQGTHEFFPRSKPADNKKDSFIFSKAPLNRTDAYQETRAKVIKDRDEDEEVKKNVRNNPKAAAKNSSFMSKLYQDDDEYDELRVLGGIDEDDEEVTEARNTNQEIEGMNRRKQKTMDKKVEKTGSKKMKSALQQINQTKAKVGKLSLVKGVLGLFAVCEVGESYLIVNHTRNTKGYIPLAGTNFKSDQFKIGQLLVAMINSEIGGAQTGQIYNLSSGKAGLNRKLQLTLDSKLINKTQNIDHLTKFMVLQAVVESVESKGYTLNFGFKDQTKGFMKFSDSSDSKSLKKGTLIHVIVQSVIVDSKIAKCELLTDKNSQQCVQQQEEAIMNNVDEGNKTTPAHVKPGFLVSGKISKVYDNGVELTFLGGLVGTCFTDHLAETNEVYKIGQKATARVISVDPVGKKITVSMKENIVNWTTVKANEALQKLEIGSKFENAKVQKQLYGDSYLVNLQKQGIIGFLHKTHTEEKKEEVDPNDFDEANTKAEATPAKVLAVGHVFQSVKVKEINYFDGMPILSSRDSVLTSKSLNYDMIKTGDFFDAKIEKVNQANLSITLSINPFVKGTLNIEHMADNSIKVIPPKFLEVGKEIRVRVFNVNSSKRQMEFTKKDSLFKAETPVFNSYKDVKKGDKIVNVIVAETEHGFVTTTFGNVKGLLTFEDIKEKLSDGYDESLFKVGNIVNAYVLFKKKDKGVALTLSKKKAKITGQEEEGKNVSTTLETGYFPQEKDVEAILENSKYSLLAKASKDRSLVGRVHQFRVLENIENKNYLVVKSTDAEKKSKNFIAILPRCLITNFSQTIQELSTELSYDGLVLEILYGQIAVISFQPELIALKDDILKKSEDDDKKNTTLSSGSTYIGVVNGVVKGGQLSVRFFNGIQKSIKVKHLNTTINYQKVYSTGKVIRVAVNKLDALSTKQGVIDACLALQGKTAQSDKLVQIESFSKQYALAIEKTGLQIGSLIEGEVQLVKDYGIIAKLQTGEECQVQTGFMINDQKNAKKYKIGQQIKCRILDIDSNKNIADLSEKLVDVKVKSSEKQLVDGQLCKAIVELDKESYLVVSMKNNRTQIGLCIASNLNGDQVKTSLQTGDEIDVTIISKHKSGYYQLIHTPQAAKSKKTSTSEKIDVKEGVRFNGQIKSIKNQCVYIQIPSSQEKGAQRMSIGRLHMIESASYTEFKSYAIGDRIDAKILKITQDTTQNRTYIELTANPNHMQKLQGLDEDQLKKTPLSAESLKVGQKYEAMIISCSMVKDEPVNLKFSQPMLVQVSPFVRGSIAFDQITSVESLAKHGSEIILSQKYFIGKSISVTYIGKGQFSLLEKANTNKTALKKGDLTTARYVKHIGGRGVTVQLANSAYGFIEMCEITDEISGNVVKYLADKSIFAARVIDTDKNGKLQLSSRESVVSEKSWKEIRPEGASIRFQEQDQELQNKGNLRNKILKYGAKLALNQGDLSIGYIVNIGKAGCFIAIGHNCVVRAGLNQLSDISDFNFQEEMPIGTIVLGRISRAHELSTGEKKFDFSTKQSHVVYGVGVIERSKLQVGDEQESIIMAIAEGKAFSQIKGTYIQIKVKGYDASAKLKIGDHVISTLKKVSKEKISSNFVKKVSHKQADMNENERNALSIFDSVKEEASKDVKAVRALLEAKHVKNDFDATLVEASNFISRDEQIAQQIKDLNELEQNQEESENDDMEVDSQDSDAADMKRLINYDDKSEEGEDSDEDMDGDSEEGEQESDPEDEEADDVDEDSSEEEETDNKTLLKKRTLKDRIVEEQEIREKEKRMRSSKDTPKDIDDFERLLVANKDQSYLWIQYMAFMLDNLGTEAARKVVERAVKSVTSSNEQDKLNIWTAFMNLESNFGTQETLEAITKRALEVNDRKKIYLNLIDIYKGSMKFEYIEVIFKQLTKKFSNNLDIWSSYIEFLIEIRYKKDQDSTFILKDKEFTDPKIILQRALQALTKDQHVNIISKYGMLEFKNGAPESGRTMFEGIVGNYPKRMDIWAIYMDMEMKYGQGNVTQARHLFERCLSNESIMKKPKKMKLVFQKYMEFESKQGNKTNISSLRERVEQYLSKVFDQNKESEDDQEASD